MDFVELRNKIKDFQKGSIHKIKYTRELKTPKKCTDVVTKETVAQGKFGVRYDHIKEIRNARNTGVMPVENAGLPKGTHWYEPPYFIQADRTGNLQLRVTKGGLSESKYYKNGQEITKEEAKKICLKSEFTNYSKQEIPSPVYNITVDKIDWIK